MDLKPVFVEFPDFGVKIYTVDVIGLVWYRKTAFLKVLFWAVLLKILQFVTADTWTSDQLEAHLDVNTRKQAFHAGKGS